jgi:hypothetical protein
MGFELEANEPLYAAVRRIAVEEIDIALRHLRRAESEDISEAVHATRQSLKRIRALLALARDELGGKVFEREWSCSRNAGRLLSRGRDAAVVVETLDALVERFSAELPQNAFASERSFLVSRRDELINTMVRDEAALTETAKLLSGARARVARWPLREAGFDAISEGLRFSYHSGLRGLKTVQRDPSPANFHEWRRPVKLLWHQLQILTPVWPVVMNAQAEELHALSDRLNANHDLDVLRNLAVVADSDMPDWQSLVYLIDIRCRELEGEAVPLGERLYMERPRRFVARVESYWQAWQTENLEAAMASRSAQKVHASSFTTSG